MDLLLPLELTHVIVQQPLEPNAQVQRFAVDATGTLNVHRPALAVVRANVLVLVEAPQLISGKAAQHVNVWRQAQLAHTASTAERAPPFDRVREHLGSRGRVVLARTKVPARDAVQVFVQALGGHKQVVVRRLEHVQHACLLDTEVLRKATRAARPVLRPTLTGTLWPHGSRSRGHRSPPGH